MNLIRHLPQFAKADRLLSTLAAHEAWTREEVDTYHLDSINALWAAAIESVPHYQCLRQDLRLPDRFETMSQFHQLVPMLPKTAVQADPMRFLSSSATKGFWCRTGGSTGFPTKVYWQRDAHLEMLRTKYRALQMWNVDYFDRTAFLWGHSNYFQPGPKGVIARFKQPLLDRLRNRLRLSAYRVGKTDLSDYLRQLDRFRPVVLYGYPTAIRLLADQASEEDVRIKSLRIIVVTGEPADADVVSTITRVFGCPVVVEYGSVDCGHLAHQWPDGSLRVREDVVHLETVPQGDAGSSIVVTPLHNFAFPLIRFNLEDLSSKPLRRPQRGFAILDDVVGRRNDFLFSRNGDVSHSARIDAFFKYQCQNIRRFQVRQKKDGAVHVAVELNAANPGIEAQIESFLSDLTGFPVTAEVVPTIDLTSAGKHRMLSSEYSASPDQEQPRDVR